jgi:tetratricopeptide (TPR) repeat protein
MDARMTAAMDRALAAELAEDYAKARTLYAEASKIDPADPVPHRFLAELYRHHTGQWTLATQTFEHLLTIQPDPLSRAVALHGLGKITIHMGDSTKGLALFEQSIDTRNSNAYLRERSPRVSFGQGWVRRSVLELFEEDISRFRVLLGAHLEEDPFAMLRRGEPPPLRALRLYTGTVGRWNRAC